MTLRTTRIASEILGHGATTRLSITRIIVEVLGGSATNNVRTTILSCEILGEQIAPSLRATRLELEVLGEQVAPSLQAIGLELEVLGNIVGLEVDSSVTRICKNMFRIQAPYPLVQTTTILPDPQFSDQEALVDTLVQKRAMDGTRYVYVQRHSDRRRVRWTFNVTRNKGLELRAFIQAYFASRWRVTDHQNQVWIGNLVGDPIEFDTPERAAPAISPMPRGEWQVVSIDFEGSKL